MKNDMIQNRLTVDAAALAASMADLYSGTMARRMSAERVDARARQIRALATWADLAVRDSFRDAASRITNARANGAADPDVRINYYTRARGPFGVLWEYAAGPSTYANDRDYVLLAEYSTPRASGDLIHELITNAAEVIAKAPRDTLITASGDLYCGELNREIRTGYSYAREAYDGTPAEILRQLRADLRWRGIYGARTRYYIAQDGGHLSREAVRDNYREISHAIRHESDPAWRICGAAVNWEDPRLYCDHTGDRIPSEYGDE